MKLYILSAAVAVVAVVSYAGSAQAQDAYVGVALEYGKLSEDNSQTAASVLAGAEFDVGIATVAIEAEYGAASTFGGDYDTTRLRLIGGYDLGGATALASIGGASYSGGDIKVDGISYGLGVQMPVTNSLDLRGEVLYDDISELDGVTTGRIAAIYSF